MKALSFAAFAVLLLSPAAHAAEAGKEEIAQAQEFFKKSLKDPDSAQFRNVLYFEKTGSSGKPNKNVCGEINAKNSYGGYVGFQPFYFSNGWGEVMTEKNKGLFVMMFDVVCKEG